MYAELDQKICIKCTRSKHVSEFGKDKSRKDGLFPYCKECKGISDSKQYQKNPNKVKARTKAWKLNNPDKKREFNRVYKKCNKEKVNSNTRKYKRKNRAVTSANTAKRRAALLQRTPKWLKELDYQHIKLFYECADAMTKETGVKFVVDHVIPLQGERISGLHIASNLQVIPARDNESKKNRYKV